MAHALPLYVNPELHYVWQMPADELDDFLSNPSDNTVGRNQVGANIEVPADQYRPFVVKMYVNVLGACQGWPDNLDCFLPDPDIFPFRVHSMAICIFEGDDPGIVDIWALTDVEPGDYEIPTDAEWSRCVATGSGVYTQLPSFGYTRFVPRDYPLGPGPSEVTVVVVAYVDRDTHPNYRKGVYRSVTVTPTYDDNEADIDLFVIATSNLAGTVFIPVVSPEEAVAASHPAVEDKYGLTISSDLRERLHKQFLPLIPGRIQETSGLQQRMGGKKTRVHSTNHLKP